MNYNIIQQLLQNGISEDEIISSLSKTIPKLGKKIGKLFAGGWSSKDILNYFSSDKEVQKTIQKRGIKPTTPSEMAAMRLRDSYNNIPKSQNEQSLEELQKISKTAAPLALTALAPYVGRAAAPMAEAALGRALPNVSPLIKQSLESGLSPSMKGLQQPQQGNVLQAPQQPPTVSPANVAQAPKIPQAETSITDPKKYLQEKGVLERVDNFLKEGRKPEEISYILGISESGRRTKEDPELLANIKAYAKQPHEISQKVAETAPINQPKEAENAPAELQVPQQRAEQVLPEAKAPAEEKPAEEKPIAKKDIVASPQGVGEVLEVRNGKALVEIDGKKHVVNEDELLESPLPEKDLADLYEDLVKGIEKETGKQVSRNVNWAGYDPNSNELAYKPHGSNKLYIYDDISEEDKNLLTNLLTQRKTTGENFIGAWGEGTESPIGAAMYQLIKKLQSERGGKGQEYKNRFESIYDALEPAVLAAKKKYAERKKKAKKPRID